MRSGPGRLTLEPSNLHLLVIGDFSDQNFCDFTGVSVQVVVDFPLSEEGDVGAHSGDGEKQRSEVS